MNSTRAVKKGIHIVWRSRPELAPRIVSGATVGRVARRSICSGLTRLGDSGGGLARRQSSREHQRPVAGNLGVNCGAGEQSAAAVARSPRGRRGGLRPEARGRPGSGNTDRCPAYCPAAVEYGRSRVEPCVGFDRESVGGNQARATGLGFEPRQTGPKPVVLPLHYPVIERTPGASPVHTPTSAATDRPVVSSRNVMCGPLRLSRDVGTASAAGHTMSQFTESAKSGKPARQPIFRPMQALTTWGPSKGKSVLE